MSQYGNIFKTSDYAKSLKQSARDYRGRKTWAEMYASTDLATQQAEAALKYNYAQDVADAYEASREQLGLIYGSNLGQGYKVEASKEINDALAEAYNSYRSNYEANLSNITTSSNEAKNQITELINQQAEYTKLYEQSHIDYLKYLFDNITSGELTADIFDEQGKLLQKGNVPANLFSEASWSRLTKQVPVYTLDDDGNYVQQLDDEDNPMYNTELLSDDEIRSLMYDEEGNLTTTGLDIYNMLENDLAQRGYKSFGSYLAEQDEINKTDLSEWAISNNLFDYSSGTNAGMFKELVGEEANKYDYDYDKTETLNNMDTEQFDKYLNDHVEFTGTLSDDDINVLNKLDEEKATEYMLKRLGKFENEPYTKEEYDAKYSPLNLGRPSYDEYLSSYNEENASFEQSELDMLSNFSEDTALNYIKQRVNLSEENTFEENAEALEYLAEKHGIDASKYLERVYEGVPDSIKNSIVEKYAPDSAAGYYDYVSIENELYEIRQDYYNALYDYVIKEIYNKAVK